jgi:putative DNA methylase
MRYERNLPHWYPDRAPIFITWRLHGSLPAGVLPSEDGKTAGQRFVQFDRGLDLDGAGPRFLEAPEVAVCVARVILRASAEMFEMGAFVVMPNHVHLLMTPRIPVGKIMNFIKGVSARECNLILRRTGMPFWAQESFDHWVRNSWEFRRIQRYVEWNPVKAGLARSPEEWPYSSAFRKNTA